jgi:hypothetical protein
MNATAQAVSIAPGVSARGVDRWIFTATAALFIVVALAGFIPTSLGKIAAVEAGTRPPLPLILHVHALLMGAWLLMLLTQASLVATDRRALHQKLGVIGAVLLPAILVSATVLFITWWHSSWSAATATAPSDALAGIRAGLSNFVLFNGRILLSFPVFIGWALLVRRSDPDSHKRLMFLGTAIPLVAGSDRFTSSLGITTLPGSPLSLELLMVANVLPLIVYDIVRRGRLHRTTLVWLAVNAALAIPTHLLWSSSWWIGTVPRLMGVQS